MGTRILPTANLTWDKLDFTKNCTAAATFNGLYFWGSRKEFIPTRQAIEAFIRSALPPQSKQPTSCEIMQWFEDVYQEENLTEYMYRESFDSCLTKTCWAISYPGNPDIAGVGMRTAYCMEAVMVTIYLAIFALRSLRPQHSHTQSPTTATRWPLQGIGHRLMDAARFSVSGFLDTAMVFNLSVVIAGIVIIPQSKKLYDMLQSTLMAGFSLGVVLAIWPLQKRIKARKLLRNGFLVLNIFLTFIEISMIYILQKWEKNTTRRETDCLPEVFQSVNRPSVYFFLLQILIGTALFGAFWVIILTAKPIPKPVSNWPLFRFVQKMPWGVITCIYGYISLWLTLGGLFYVRHLVQVRIGESYSDNSWGFGQVMALATWLPTQAEFMSIFIRPHIFIMEGEGHGTGLRPDQQRRGIETGGRAEEAAFPDRPDRITQPAAYTLQCRNRPGGVPDTAATNPRQLPPHWYRRRIGAGVA
ncbi:uncharacterized protein BP5553_05112 [Venustampulla echinocandica]|uniref:Uncharacterized protein n=1 Tax=Venustampulla echinocandica TaxID=2656787 RepID=A0A370TQ75_9HELO|nr:uncharacterized protein BP5553_05112 [Venustampulla echinocandica]RDL37679.1 hypothetical protein BP5553_05112 [Venustampulla echinocandica]